MKDQSKKENDDEMPSSEEWNNAIDALNKMKHKQPESKRTATNFIKNNTDIICQLREKGHKPREIALLINESSGNHFNYKSLTSLIYSLK